jgi:hypothetical protein
MNVLAALGNSDRLKILDRFIGESLLHHSHMLVSTIGGNDHVDIGADRLCRRIPVEPFRRRIPGRDRVVEHRGDDRVAGRFHGGKKGAVALRAALELCGALLFALLGEGGGLVLQSRRFVRNFLCRGPR